jgi:hypothetical protein
VFRVAKLHKLRWSYYIFAMLRVTFSLSREKVNLENKKGASTFPAEENQRLTVMNGQ